jgi:hypothetical protein
MKPPTPGTKVCYRDFGAARTPPEGTESMTVEGVVNGAALHVDDDWWVPVWTNRDRGREATTIIVHSGNLLPREEDA